PVVQGPPRLAGAEARAAGATEPRRRWQTVDDNRVAPTKPLTAGPAWKALQEHYRTIRDVHLRQIFADDPLRGKRLTGEAAGLYLDYSKHRVTDETLRLLLRLADDRHLAEHIGAMLDRKSTRLNSSHGSTSYAVFCLKNK